MALPPGFLDELRSRTSIAQVVGKKVLWDSRKSNQGKGDMWAPCPFHQEKTASFHVDDRKGYYYCFGCNAKGDAIGFIKETENVSFIEAVEILCIEAGMQLPAVDPAAKQKLDRQAQLAGVMEDALNFFRLNLNTSGAADVRSYLNDRGLKDNVAERFEIGFAPDSWQALWDHLKNKSVDEELIFAAGLAKSSTNGKRPYDTFRNRIIFPIRDPRGRCIGFGGRAMDLANNAKYLNSPETELFDKGRNLYNLVPAREAVGKGQSLIVAEGYMDVIALGQAGFNAAVAPLGTAVTETQLQLIWRLSDEPIIALDGDLAGIRAAHRLIDMALPLVEAGKSLRFAVLPEGQDPDDLIRANGSKAMQGVIDNARPMIDMLWDREVYGKNFDSPERKAALDKTLREKLKLIKDTSIRRHYAQTLKSMRWELFRIKSKAAKSGRWKNESNLPRATTRSSSLVHETENNHFLRQSVILASLLKTPKALKLVKTQLEDLQFSTFEHQKLQQFLLQYSDPLDDLFNNAEQIFGVEELQALLRLPHVRIAPSVRNFGDVDLVVTCLLHEFAQIFAIDAHGREVDEAVEDQSDQDDEGLTWRLGESAKQVQVAQHGGLDDKTHYRTASNGLKVSLDEQNKLKSLLDDINFSKTNSE